MPAAAHVPVVETRHAAFRRALLRWYDKNRRDLPWRKSRDPYRIWLSEIMLQQTRVAAVLEHYRLFLQRFPNLRTLATASESNVLAAWSGLGYYRRARMLRQCAQQIVQDHHGQFPKTSKALQALPGIGRYTAAAIASIAFAEPVAVVDGNVERVLERMTGRSLTLKDMWQQAQSLLSESRPGDFNQAMMELGATVCTPRQPKCEACPVRKWCATQGELPRIRSKMERRAPSPGQKRDASVKPPRSRQNRKEIWCALNQRDGHIRLVQRPENSSLMAGMWELPQWPKDRSHTPPSEIAAKRRKITVHGASGGTASDYRQAPKGRKTGDADSPATWRTFRHSITTTNYTVHVLRAEAPATKGRWIAIGQIPDLPITGLTRKILKAGGII